MVSSIGSSTNDTPKNFRLFIGCASKGESFAKKGVDTDLYVTSPFLQHSSKKFSRPEVKKCQGDLPPPN